MAEAIPAASAAPSLSVADAYQATCPLCGTHFAAKLWRIVDLDTDTVREADLCDGSLQRTYCPVCIGPGVERLGAVCIVASGPNGRMRACYAFDPSSVDPAFDSLDKRFAARCTQLGLKPGNFPIEFRGLVESVAEIERSLSEHMEIELRKTHVSRLRAAVALLNAKDCEERRTIVLENPDLVRPASISMLASLPELDRRLILAQVRPILGLLTAATWQGIEPAIALCRADYLWMEVLRSLPEAVSDAYFQAHPESDTPTAAEFERCEANVEQFLQDCSGSHPVIGAKLCLETATNWMTLGPEIGDAAWQRSRYWFGRVLHYEDPSIAPRYMVDALLGLSTCLQEMQDGDPAANNKQAINCSEAAVALAEKLSDEELAQALMELGIARTRQVTGDSFVNRSLAREAFNRANLAGVSNLTRLLVIYNEALTWIEEESGDVVKKINIGLTKLRGISELASTSFSLLQRERLHQSLGAALLRRGNLTGSVEDLASAAGEFETAFRLARERGVDGARLLYLRTAAEVEEMIRGAQAPDGAYALSAIDAIQSIYGAGHSPSFFMETQRLRARVLETFPPPGTPPDAAIRARQLVMDVLPSAATPADGYRLACALEGRSDFAGAAGAFAMAAGAAEALLSASATSERLEEEIGRSSVIYEGLVRTLAVLAERGERDGWEVLAAMERGRARDLLDELGSRHLPPPVGVAAELLAEEADLRVALASEPRDSISGMLAAEGEMDRRMQRRETLRGRLVRIYEEISSCSAAGAQYVRLRRPQPPDPEALRRLIDALPAGAAVLSFWTAATGATAVLARPAKPIIVRPVLFDAACADNLLACLHAHVGINPLAAQETDGDWQGAGMPLLEPFETEIRQCDRLIIVPHGPIHRIPLHAVRLSGRQTLIDVAATQFVPSLGIMRDLDFRPADPPPVEARVLCCAETPAERSSFEAEARMIAELLGIKATFDASRNDLLESAADAGLVHLVCHGRFEDKDPLTASLLLKDGFVTVRDLLAVRLRASLVCLAACETGLVAAESGDRLKGFAQALILAGAGSTVLTLWRVSSEPTRFWMGQFYKTLASGTRSAADRARAHRMATLETKQRYPHPAYWAPFVLSGQTQ